MENNILIQDFLNYLKLERHFSSHTAKCYGADLTQFSQFLSDVSERSHAKTKEDFVSGGHGTATAVQTRAKLQIDQLLL